MRIARVADPEGRIFRPEPAEEGDVVRELRGAWDTGFTRTGRNPVTEGNA